MITSLTFDNAEDLHEHMCKRLMYGTKRGTHWDWIHGTEVGLHNVSLGARSFDWDFDLKRLWMPKTRWTMMVRQYIDPDALEDWRGKVAERLVGKGRGIAVLRTRTVQGRGTGKGVRRRWGSCMLAMSYRANPVPTITLHSRTTYFGYLAAMDISVANQLAWEAHAITGVHPADMQFVWNLELAQFHGFRSLAWPIGDPTRLAQLIRDEPNRFNFGQSVRPGYRKSLDGIARILKSDREGKLYGDEAFSSFARVRRRFHTEAYGMEYGQQFAGGSLNRGGKGPFPPLPSVSTRDLDFTCLAKGVGSPENDDDYEDDEDE
jgi:hypothetical protein